VASSAHTVNSFYTLLQQSVAIMLEDTFAQVSVDSIMATFRVDYSGRNETAERI
jgi:hypothetical protein